MHSYRLLSVFNKFIILYLIANLSSAYGVVDVDRTRVIFNENENSKTFRLKNSGTEAVIIQVWTDKGEIAASPESIKTPVIAIPPVSKMFSNEMRTYRLILTSRDGLKPGVETLYWLNIYELPSLAKSGLQSDYLLVIPVRLRLKVLVRPAGLLPPASKDYKKLKFIRRRNRLIVKNPTPYYISLNAALTCVTGSSVLLLAPSSDSLSCENTSDLPDHINYTVIDDSGMHLSFKTTTSD